MATGKSVVEGLTQLRTTKTGKVIGPNGKYVSKRSIAAYKAAATRAKKKVWNQAGAVDWVAKIGQAKDAPKLATDWAQGIAKGVGAKAAPGAAAATVAAPVAETAVAGNFLQNLLGKGKGLMGGAKGGGIAGLLAWLAAEGLMSSTADIAGQAQQASAMDIAGENITPENYYYQAMLPQLQEKNARLQQAFMSSIMGGNMQPEIPGQVTIGG